jgi:rubrerythrin
MASFFRRWLLSRIIKSALVFEEEAIERYKGLLDRIDHVPARRGLEHLRDEEEAHWRILTQAAEGKIEIEELEKQRHEHHFEHLSTMEPLDRDLLERWGEEITKALEREKETFIFYGNLRRMSNIPAVKRAFEVLADMEKEHVDILSRLLGGVGE